MKPVILTSFPSALPGLLALAMLTSLGAGSALAQEIRYRVREYQAPIPLVFPGAPQAAVAPAPDADASADAAPEDTAEAPAETDGAESSDEGAEPATEVDAPTGDDATTEVDTAAATTGAAQPVVTLAEIVARGDFHLVEAILQSEVLQVALSSALDDRDAWRVLRDQAVEQPRGSMRTGAILAIDSTLAIKRLPADLTEHLAQVAGQVASRREQGASRGAVSPTALRSALIEVLAGELENESPDWALVHRLLTSIDRLSHPAADRLSHPAAATDSPAVVGESAKGQSQAGVAEAEG